MKKILILFGSPHILGKTAALLDIYLEKYLKNLRENFEIRKISLDYGNNRSGFCLLFFGQIWNHFLILFCAKELTKN